MNYVKFKQEKYNIGGTVSLPPSKSESNRVLMIKAISGRNFTVHNLSDADDTALLIHLLNQIDKRTDFNDTVIVDAGAAGTVMRFLMPYLSVKKGKWLLTGDERMLERPIGPLVHGLKQLGAEINYFGKNGYPPVIIEGSIMDNHSVQIDSSLSSQFVSALLMIAPTLKNGLKIYLTNELVSLPFIEMTLKIMKYFGIQYICDKNSFTVHSQFYQPKDYVVNLDWSAASIFYEIVALSETGSAIFLNGLKKTGMQGDEMIAKIYEKFGVETRILDKGISIVKCRPHMDELSFDFRNYPDIAPGIIVSCAALGVKANFSGIKNLAIKESNRILALRTELEKIDCNVIIYGNDNLMVNEKVSLLSKEIIINTYNDHRIAMAFAPLAMLNSNIIIENPEVVTKSYKYFWENLKKAGFIFDM